MADAFVIEEHGARTHKFAFMLQSGDVFKNWALPRAVPETAGIKRLAIEVEDAELPDESHQAEAGVAQVWDSGSYKLHEWTASKIVFTLQGRRVKGSYSLARLPQDGSNWLLIKLGGLENLSRPQPQAQI